MRIHTELAYSRGLNLLYEFYSVDRIVLEEERTQQQVTNLLLRWTSSQSKESGGRVIIDAKGLVIDSWVLFLSDQFIVFDKMQVEMIQFGICISLPSFQSSLNAAPTHSFPSSVGIPALSCICLMKDDKFTRNCFEAATKDS